MKLMRFTPLQIAIGVAMLALVALAIFHGMSPALMLVAPAAAATLEDLSIEFAKKSSEMKTQADDLKEAHTELLGRLEKDGNTSRELKEAIDKALTNFNGLKGTVDELEQKLSARVVEDRTEAKSWGEQLVGSDAFKAAQAAHSTLSSKRGVISTEVKQVTSAAAGGLVRQTIREAEVVQLMRERRVVRDLLTTIAVNTPSIEYAVQTLRTNNAAPVAESAAKPYSDYAWTVATANVRVLAHLAKITRQAMDDAPRLMGEIDSEMRYGLGFVEERQFLYGNGTGQNLFGIVPQATDFAVPAGFPTMANATRIDALRLAMLQASIGLLPADGIVLNQLDWAVIELTKTTDGAYLFANPQGNVDARMWGLPVVATPAMNAGDFLVGSFKMGATVYDRMGVEVLISTENSDDFEKNLATMRAEERVAIAVKRPGAFITGDFTTAIADIAA